MNERVNEAMLRCATLVTTLTDRPNFDPVVFDEAVALITGPLAGQPGQGRLAGQLIRVIMRWSRDVGMRRFAVLGPLLTVADTDPSSAADWPRVRAAATILATLHAATDGDLSTPGVDQLSGLRDLTDDDPALATMYRLTQMGLASKRALTGQDPAALHEIQEHLRHLTAMAADVSPMAPYMDFLETMSDVVSAQRHGDLDGAIQAMASMRESTSDPAIDPELHSAIEDSLVLLPLLRDTMATLDDPGHVGGNLDEQLAAVRARLDRPDATGLEQEVLNASVTAAAIHGDSTPARTEAAITELRAAAADAPIDGPTRVVALTNLATALMRRSERTNTVADLPEAADAFEKARALAGGPDHQLWQLINEGLSLVQRRRGADPDARRAALAGLRTFAWRVLLQPNLRSATIAARDAAKEAMDVARWCLRDSEPGDAVSALDAGRGLLLFAAIELRDLAGRLAAAGQPDLVDRWHAATATGGPEAAPATLRREVLAALTATGSGLLDPPSLPEIRTALSTLDADALVYLLPGSFPHTGAAVIVPVDGPPCFLPLANLYVDGDTEFERYLQALNARDLDLGSISDDHFADRIDQLCDWAWRAAIGPLLTRYLHGRPTPGGRPHRVFLVPMGDLARVPWQAARHADGMYALQAAAFSYVASARTLCESARLPPVPLTPAGLVVGDPNTGGLAHDLPAARAEGFAIHRAFYPGSRYLGRRPDEKVSRSGPGDRNDVLRWLTEPPLEAGSMLHLACHAIVHNDPAETTSYLLLADGSRLTAEELVGTMSAHPERALALVVLAACRTGVSPYGYDEAYSLGTAFLAAGARAVLSTQWSIPDQDTSVLTFMFHHHLVTERLPVWAALRKAQLWMLDPNRKTPDTMPTPLRRQLVESRPERVVAWAGFVHWGQ